MRIAFILASFCCAIVSAASEAKPLVIVDGTLINPGAAPVEHATVVIRDGRIAAVGPSKDVAVPSDATVVQATGKWIMPGLIDAHVHFFQSGGLYTRPDIIDLRFRTPYAKEIAAVKAGLDATFRRYLRCGITAVADVGGPFWNFEVRSKAQENPCAPTVAVAGPLISTYQPRGFDTDDPPIIGVKTADEAKALATKEAEKKPDFIKIWYIAADEDGAKKALPLVAAAIEESHRQHIRVAVHATELETARLAVKSGADLLVHSVGDKPVDDAFIALLKERKVVYTTTLLVHENYQRLFTNQMLTTKTERKLGDPRAIASWLELRNLADDELPDWLAGARKTKEKVDHQTIAIANLKTLHAAGIPIAAGTDAGNIGTLHGPSLYHEFELMSLAGLSAADILETATRGGAMAMGRDDLGEIKVGNCGDVLVVNADPLENIQNALELEVVVKNGVVFTVAELE